LCENVAFKQVNFPKSKAKFKGIVSRDLMRKKRPFDGFIGWIISRRYSWIGFIFNFKAVFIFKFLNLNAQLAYLWVAHASRSLHVPVSKVLYGTWGTARAAQRGDYLCSPALGDIMNILTYTAKRLLPGTYTAPGEA
jgi:hypothetical protein